MIIELCHYKMKQIHKCLMKHCQLRSGVHKAKSGYASANTYNIMNTIPFTSFELSFKSIMYA